MNMPNGKLMIATKVYIITEVASGEKGGKLLFDGFDFIQLNQLGTLLSAVVQALKYPAMFIAIGFFIKKSIMN